MKRFIDTPFVQAWHTIGGKTYFFKSSWEVIYAKWLQWLKEVKKINDWEYEPEQFWFDAIKRGTTSYVVDFKIHLLNGDCEYHEVKGYMDQKSRTKLKRFIRYYPKLQIKLVTGAWFKKYKHELRALNIS